MSNDVDIQLADLLGLHALHGIARDVITAMYGDTVQRVALLVDDFVVELCEDENDGYRSSLGSIRRWQSVSRYIAEHDDVSFAPIHPPLIVMIRHRKVAEHSGEADAIYAIDERTGLVVLDIGTDQVDDYYPSFVFSWDPAGWPLPEWIS